MTDTQRTAVCFDLDYTLLAFDREFAAVVRDALDAEFDVVTDAMIEAVGETLLDHLADEHPEPYRAAAAAACEAAEGDADATAVRDRLWDAELEWTSVADPARDALATLAADEAYVVCVITDGHDEWQREKLAHHGLDEHVAHVVTSYDAGGAKETGAPYDHLRERVDAAEYVMIGDDYAGDVEAAREAGFVPIHYEETDGPDFFATLSAML